MASLTTTHLADAIVSEKGQDVRVQVGESKDSDDEQNKQEKHLIFCIDRSGSMAAAGKEAMYQTVNGIVSNTESFENAVVTMVTFDNKIELIMEKTSINNIDSTNFNKDSFVPRGSTALYDAILLCLDKIDDPKQTLLTIITDGQDNASQTSMQQVKELAIEMWSKGCQGKFLGCANATTQAKNILNLDEEHVLQYDVTESTVRNASSSLHNTMTTWSMTGMSPGFTPAQRTSSMTPQKLRNAIRSANVFGATTGDVSSFPTTPRSRRTANNTSYLPTNAPTLVNNDIQQRFQNATRDQLSMLRSVQSSNQDQPE